MREACGFRGDERRARLGRRTRRGRWGRSAAPADRLSRENLGRRSRRRGRDGARDAAPAADGRRLERRESLLRGRKRVGGLGGTNSMREARDSCGDERQAGRGRRARRRRWGRSAARSDGLRRENLDRRSRRAGRARAARGRRENEKLPCARRCREKRGVAPVRRGAPGFRLGSDGAAEVSPAQRRRSRRVLTSLRIVVQLF